MFRVNAGMCVVGRHMITATERGVGWRRNTGVVCGVHAELPATLAGRCRPSLAAELEAAEVLGSKRAGQLASVFGAAPGLAKATFVSLGNEQSPSDDPDTSRRLFGRAVREWMAGGTGTPSSSTDSDDGRTLQVYAPVHMAQLAGEAAALALHRYPKQSEPLTHADRLAFDSSFFRPDGGSQAVGAMGGVQLEYMPSGNGSPSEAVAAARQQFQAGVVGGQAQNLARDWATRPANDLSPGRFAEEARQLLTGLPGVITFDEHDARWLADRGMGLILGVAQASHGEERAARMLEVVYDGTQALKSMAGVAGPSSSSSSSSSSVSPPPPLITLVGKGVMFDTGGVSLKPSRAMADMRGDMTGAAAAVALVHGLARLRAPVRLRVLAPLVANCIGSRAVKPGDVLRSASGLTVEIDNTDAEGRLILADALWWAAEQARLESARAPVFLSLATLTGNVGQALGEHFAGAFSTDDDLFGRLERAGRHSGDRVWRLPLHDLYRDELRSPTADLVNCSPTKATAGAITAALFLRQFLPPAVHFCALDIGGQLMAESDMGYLLNKQMRGGPVRGLMQFCQEYSTQT